MSWIIYVVSKEIAESVLYIDNAFDVWIDLHEQFHQSNGPRIFQIKQQLNNLSQGSADISSYFTKLKALWAEFKEFRPISNCTYGALKELMEFQNQEYVLQFLMGLNDSYSHVRAQILMLDPLPSINKVFSLVIQEERQRGLISYCFTSVSSPNIAAFGVATGNYNPYKRRRDKPLCTHCGFLGHTIDKCYNIHGYPPVFKK
ncbi:hypothetical protein UlMin_012184 [Ulmus minor]